MKLPRTLAIVVDSEVLGSTAVSVPFTKAATTLDQPEGIVSGYIKLSDVEDALDILETRYLDSHKVGNEDEVKIEVAVLADKASLQVMTGDTTWDDLAGRCGWTREDAEYANGRRGDGQKLRELLGVAKGTNVTHRTLEYDDANALVKALGLDPVDVGL